MASFIVNLMCQTQKSLTIAEFANAADTGETTHNELCDLDLQYLPSHILIFGFEPFFFNFADVILSSAFLAFYLLKVDQTVC